MSSSDLNVLQRMVLWPPLRFVLPTMTALLYNRWRLTGELKTSDLPAKAWAQKGAEGLMARSEDRLRSLEGKAFGLVAVAAIVAAGVVAAIVAAGSDATAGGKVLLAIAAWYAIWSLFVPLYLVGPQPRDTIDLNHLIVAAGENDPQQYLTVRAQRAAQLNVRRAHRIGNLQDAARNECGAALAVLTVWLLLGPVLGLVVHDKTHQQSQRPTRTMATTTRTSPPPATSAPPLTTSAPRTTPKSSGRPRPHTTPSTGGAQAPDPPG